MLTRRTLHVGLPGIGYIFVTLLIGLGAVNSQNNLLFWAFGVAIVALLISGVISGAMLMRVDAVREEIETSSVGRPLRIRYALCNRARLLPAFAITIEEVAQRRAGGASWPSHMPQPRGFVAHIAPRKTMHAVAAVRPTRRGEATFDAFRIVSAFPFGLFRKSIVFMDAPGREARALIQPEIRPVRRGVVRELVRSAAEGEITADLPGRGDEFFGLREYAPGDSPRHIAWRPSARTGELVVREHVAPSPARLWIGLALRTDDDAKREAAISMAASLLVEAQQERVEAGLHVLPGDIRVPPGAGSRRLGAMLDALARIGPGALGEGESFRRRQASRGAWIVVHDADPSRALAPAEARHFTAQRPDAVFTEDARPDPRDAGAPDGGAP